MQKNREIRKSVQKRLRDMFQAPDSSTGWGPFNVYGEVQFRDESFVPIAPFVFLVDSYLPLAKRRLPMIIIDLAVDKSTFELGSRGGRIVNATLGVLGATRGQRDDFASYIQDLFGNTIQIYSYPNEVEVETAELDDLISILNMYPSGPINKAVDLSYLFWSTVKFTFRTKE